MNPYKDLDNDSGVLGFEIEDDAIIVHFKKGKFTKYKYTYSSAGAAAIEKMKTLAHSGEGLNSYISTSKPPFQSKG